MDGDSHEVLSMLPRGREGLPAPSSEELLRARVAAFERAERMAEIGSFQIEMGARTVRWSPQMFRLYGMPADAPQPSLEEVLLMTHPEDREGVTLATRELAAKGRAEPFTFRVVGQDGVTRLLLGRAELVRDEATREPVLVAGTVSDESERHRVEHLVLRGEKLLDVGRIVGSVAHDWNNLLSIIVGSATIARRASTEAPVKEELARLLDACDSSSMLLRQMLAFSRRQELPRRVIGLDEILAPIEWMVKRLLGPRVELRVELAAEPWQIVGDPGGVERALVNLAMNAKDALVEGGSVVVRVENREASGALRKDHAVLSVTDDGPGMCPVTRARAFEPFFTTKGERGTGLGLSTVQGIVNDHGGLVELDTALGRGTTVRLLFPRAPLSALR